MHLKMTLGPILCLFACASSGCATVIGRMGVYGKPPDVPPVYPATYCDVTWMTAPCRSSFEGSAGKKAAACAIGTIDLPISLAIDTLLLPLDAVMAPPVY
jgi:uncharacterized protein YceK